MNILERSALRNMEASKILESLKLEYDVIRRRCIQKKIHEIENENDNLRKEIEKARITLIDLEKSNGKMQIPIPGDRQPSAFETVEVQNPSVSISKSVDKKSKQPKQKLVPKKESAAASSANAEPIDDRVDVGRLDMRIGKIVEVSAHPDADSLYLEKIDCGEDKPRTVISGLVKFVPIEEMKNRMVVLLCNLKPAKMRGIVSEAMVMCASTPDKVEILEPPSASIPGDFVNCEGYERKPDAQLNPKKKIFETCAPDLKTNESCIACYKGSPLFIREKGVIKSATLANTFIK